jgi:hypothetical protein
MVRTGSSVRVRQRAWGHLQGKSAKVGGLRRRLAQRVRSSRPRSVHFVAPYAPVVEANRPAVWSIPRVPPAADSFSASARLVPFCVPPPGGPEERWGSGAVARFADGRDPSLGEPWHAEAGVLTSGQGDHRDGLPQTRSAGWPPGAPWSNQDQYL